MRSSQINRKTANIKWTILANWTHSNYYARVIFTGHVKEIPILGMKIAITTFPSIYSVQSGCRLCLLLIKNKIIVLMILSNV
ncbi:hypothetical protein GWI33_014276 [Rhynchophorus ferrugineus]|uniref:Uncharacterized protein n=1 Tax=Rhynchophorus ferrugineus TaxID=354439 RepID=A0A834M5Q4_RHYFE|nr:hypothetical protein GWI33_014276 [Rhynchophorus ferrugineus]